MKNKRNKKITKKHPQSTQHSTKKDRHKTPFKNHFKNKTSPTITFHHQNTIIHSNIIQKRKKILIRYKKQKKQKKITKKRPESPQHSTKKQVKRDARCIPEKQPKGVLLWGFECIFPNILFFPLRISPYFETIAPKYGIFSFISD